MFIEIVHFINVEGSPRKIFMVTWIGTWTSKIKNFENKIAALSVAGQRNQII